MSTWPDSLWDFAFIPVADQKFVDLAAEAEDEEWDYQNTSSNKSLPVLQNYISYTYKRLAEQEKICVSNDAQYSCFNTGLVTESQEPIYASFEVNRQQATQNWFFKGWFRKGRWEMNQFSDLPELATYFDDPTCLVFDTRKELRVNVEHIVEENLERFPPPYNTMGNYQLQTLLKGAVDNAKERVKRNYKAAIPQYYAGHIQLLLPLCIQHPHIADLALVVERHPNFYRASTCLPLDWAYNNARQLARPDRDWLQP